MTLPTQTAAGQMPPLLPAALRHDPWVDHEGRVLMELCVVGDYVTYEDHIAYAQAYAAQKVAALRTELAPAVRGEAVAIPDGLIACLRGGRQCDMDGSEIIMSRQACCEAADILESIATTPQPAIDTDKLRQIIAATYQIAGALDAPEHVLDVLANPELATQAQIDALLPFVPAKTVGREVTDALTNAEIMAIADSTKTAEPGKDGYILPISFARAIIAATNTKPAPPLQDAKDAELLDFLISNTAYVVSDETCADGYWLRFVTPGVTLVQMSEYATPRGAIRAAIASQKGSV